MCDRNRFRSAGFTLVELLIVLVIAGILSGSLMLVYGDVSAKAKATMIVANMRTVKAAAQSYYADHGRWFPEDWVSSSSGGNRWGDDGSFLNDYLDRDFVESDWDSGQFFVIFWIPSGGNGHYYVTCNLWDSFGVTYKTRLALGRMAADCGLYDAGGVDGAIYTGAGSITVPDNSASGQGQCSMLISPNVSEEGTSE